MRPTRIFLVGLLCASVLTACYFDKYRLRGKWETADQTLIVEFLGNGDVLWTQPLGTVTGTWELVERHRVKVSFSGLAGLMGPQYCGYSFEDKTLVMTGDCVLAEHYTRALK